MTTHKSITVPTSGLSKLQKRILIYAHQRMVDKGQTLEPDMPDDEGGTWIWLVAPDWLTKAVIESTNAVFEGRKRGIRDGEIITGHPTVQFLEELRYVEKAVATAAQKVSVSLRHLWRLAAEASDWLDIRLFGSLCGFDPTLALRNGKLCFLLKLNLSVDDARQRLRSDIDAGTVTLSADDERSPLNCTIPEMLRDLYGFPVSNGGHLDALAFDPDAIGRQKYNAANAALRRACDRLWKRRLIVMRRVADQSHWFSTTYYERTAIGLTKAGLDAVTGAAGVESLAPDNGGPGVRLKAAE
jgi:hypothetical protein